MQEGKKEANNIFLNICRKHVKPGKEPCGFMHLVKNKRVSVAMNKGEPQNTTSLFSVLASSNASSRTVFLCESSNENSVLPQRAGSGSCENTPQITKAITQRPFAHKLNNVRLFNHCNVWYYPVQMDFMKETIPSSPPSIQ